MSGDAALEWWQTTIIYQIYPRSFSDSNGDGIGDLKGVTSKLDYFTYLNIGAIWLSPFFKSPMKDFGYDVSDFKDVDPIFGTLKDFEQLVQEAHKRGIKVIVDFVPNHTSNQHDWFQRSCRREKPYDDYYIWCDGKRDKDGKPQPPNNWLSQFGRTAWRWHEGRQQFYYTAFLAEQPDLNYRNPLVVKEMNDVVRFWMERGVDGMRVDALDYLFEDPDVFQDEPRSNLPGVESFEFEYNDHIHTMEKPEILDIVRGWRQIFDEFQKKDREPRFMVIETYAKPKWRNQYYKAGANPFNLDMCLTLQPPLSGTKVRDSVDQEYTNLPDNGWPTFVLGNHDRKRLSSKFGAEYVDALNVLLLTLRGTPCTYYGEELGMQEIEVTFEQTKDPWGKNYGPKRFKEFSRDPWRAPMQWDDTKNAGFSSNPLPWLPVHPDYVTRNVKVQQKSPKQTSLQLYAALAKLRQEPVFQKGEVLFSVTNDNVFSYVRQIPGSDASRYLIVLNLGQMSTKEDYSGSPVNSARGVVVQATCSVIDRIRNKEVGLKDLELAPGDGMVIRLM
ncbi:maltase 1-like [Littorina saxatilis]|uniref:Glycosyl hydrolase family 13 catalytic domain-containing protein n=1 Tax=Littorina saxatilis TaxID=31220 RepID=A0AAN9B2M6_9CAEN